MPRNVRNSWVTLKVDGKARPVAMGPKSKDGALVATFNVRKDGAVSDGCTVDIRPERYSVLGADGKTTDSVRIVLRVFGPDGVLILKHETER